MLEAWAHKADRLGGILNRALNKVQSRVRTDAWQPSKISRESTRIASSSKPFAPTSFSYYEYKYHVPHENMELIRKLLDEFYGHTDPFPSGIVDSIYYDTADQRSFLQCLNGEADKNKFRIRGYGDGSFHQLHQKTKHLASVSKDKCKIKAVTAPRELAPTWDDIEALTDSWTFQKIQFQARRFGALFPSIRVRYQRFRYRAYDYRITLDTNIEVFTPANGLPRNISYGSFPHHVLEIKTCDERPKLPFIGLVQLPQVSFSKFMLGLLLLNSD